MSDTVIHLASKKKCTGCHLCKKGCPVGAISFIKNDLGFAYPVVDGNKCIKCGKCMRLCPELNNTKRNTIDRAFAARSKDSKVLKSSASGGAFSCIAKQFIINGGVVYGCFWSKENKWCPEIIRIQSLTDIKKIQGSKYLESENEASFDEVKRDLDCGRSVLYGARPCQVAALYNYLNSEEIEKLYTVDLICHGVPSWNMFSQYLLNQEKRYKGTVLDYKFRAHKSNSNRSHYFGSIKIQRNNRIKTKTLLWECDSYYYFFMKGVSNRESCYSCSYASRQRVGDITIGDFWGIEKIVPGEMAGNISLVLSNSQKGLELIRESDELHLNETDVNKSCDLNGQLNHPTPCPQNLRKWFVNRYKIGGWKGIAANFKKMNMLNKAKAKIVFLLPDKLKDLLK